MSNYIKNFIDWSQVLEANQVNFVQKIGTEDTLANPKVAAAQQEAKPTAKAAITLTSPDGKLLAADIIKVQNKLIELGILAPTQPSGNTAADGRVGPATTAAIQAFRAKYGLVPANAPVTQYSIGPKTYAKFQELFAEDSKKAAATTTTTTAAPIKPAEKTSVKPEGVTSDGDTIVVKPAGAEGTLPGGEFNRTKKDDAAAVGMADSILAKFQDKAFWKPFKGALNDNEKEAGEAFNRWYQDTILLKLNALNDDDENKEILKKALDSIVKKLRGGQTKDKLTFNLKTLLGDRAYTVNTDF